MKIKLIIILFAILPLQAYGLELYPTIGISSIYTNINDPNFKYTDKWNPAEITGLNTGLSLNHNNIILGFSTNRVFNRSVERQVQSKKSGINYNNKTKVYADSLFIGYQLNRWQPSLFIANANVKKLLYKNDTLLNQTQQSSVLWGMNLGYFVTRHFQAIFTYIAPNREQYLESGFGVGFNYIF